MKLVSVTVAVVLILASSTARAADTPTASLGMLKLGTPESELRSVFGASAKCNSVQKQQILPGPSDLTVYCENGKVSSFDLHAKAPADSTQEEGLPWTSCASLYFILRDYFEAHYGKPDKEETYSGVTRILWDFRDKTRTVMHFRTGRKECHSAVSIFRPTVAKPPLPELIVRD